MKINQHLETGSCSPVARRLQVRIGSGDVWRAAATGYRPITDRYPHKVQTSCSNGIHVGLLNPAIPVGVQPAVAFGLAICLAESVLIHDIVWCSLEDAWSNPWLEDEPPAKVDTAHFLATKAELKGIVALEGTTVIGRVRQ